MKELQLIPIESIRTQVGEPFNEFRKIQGRFGDYMYQNQKAVETPRVRQDIWGNMVNEQIVNEKFVGVPTGPDKGGEQNV